MKKISYLFLLVGILVLSSCNNDNDNSTPQNTNSFVAKIDGVSVSFDQVTVAKDVQTDYIDLLVTAKVTGDDSKTITFNLTQLVTGIDACYYFAYIRDATNYTWDSETGGNSFVMTVTENTTTRIKGTFSGTLPNDDVTSAIAISNATFDINY